MFPNKLQGLRRIRDFFAGVEFRVQGGVKSGVTQRSQAVYLGSCPLSVAAELYS